MYLNNMGRSGSSYLNLRSIASNPLKPLTRKKVLYAFFGLLYGLGTLVALNAGWLRESIGENLASLMVLLSMPSIFTANLLSYLPQKIWGVAFWRNSVILDLLMALNAIVWMRIGLYIGSDSKVWNRGKSVLGIMLLMAGLLTIWYLLPFPASSQIPLHIVSTYPLFMIVGLWTYLSSGKGGH